jgi:hypothetical protein
LEKNVSRAAVGTGAGRLQVRVFKTKYVIGFVFLERIGFSATPAGGQSRIRAWRNQPLPAQPPEHPPRQLPQIIVPLDVQHPIVSKFTLFLSA